MPIAVKKHSDQFEMKFLFGYRLFCWKLKYIYIYIYIFKLIFISEFTVYLFALFMDNKKKKKKEGGRRIQTNTKHFKS